MSNFCLESLPNSSLLYNNYCQPLSLAVRIYLKLGTGFILSTWPKVASLRKSSLTLYPFLVPYMFLVLIYTNV